MYSSHWTSLYTTSGALPDLYIFGDTYIDGGGERSPCCASVKLAEEDPRLGVLELGNNCEHISGGVLVVWKKSSRLVAV